MAISKDLFLTILSMDAYNRGYNAGIQLSDEEGTQIGAAKINVTSGQVDSIKDTAQAAGFYAIAYDTPYGLVISYRGTDDPSFASNGDILTGWTVSLGILAIQARLAAEFYHSVKNDPNNAGKNIILTGHSLGGGLAGMVASLFAEEAVIFDNMPFALASDAAYEAATRTDAQIDVLAASVATVF